MKIRRPGALPVLAWGLLALGGADGLDAGEVSFTYASLERAVWATMLTEGGRHYLEGDPGSTCRFAFVQEPRVDAAEGRLRIRFLFSGRAGVEVKGRCLGPGDTFDMEVSGVPTVSDGELWLAELRVTAEDTAYFRLVSGLVESRLREKLRYPLRRQVEHAVAAASTGQFRLSLTDLRIDEVAAAPEALRVSYGADVTVH